VEILNNAHFSNQKPNNQKKELKFYLVISMIEKQEKANDLVLIQNLRLLKLV